MFKKILLAEDLDTISLGVQQTLSDLGVEKIEQVQYCDDAYLKILKAHKDQEPFDLLITDLSFKEDHRAQKLSSGESLAEKIKEEFPATKVIIYSIEDRLEKIRYFIQNVGVEGYVCKGRRGLQELKTAINDVYKGKVFIASEVRYQFNNPASVEITDSDILLLQLLSKGLSQEQISKELKNKKIHPSSLSWIEKRLNILKHHFGAANSINLIAITKDVGLI